MKLKDEMKKLPKKEGATLKDQMQKLPLKYPTPELKVEKMPLPSKVEGDEDVKMTKLAKGGRVMKNEGMMEKKMGKGMAKADMQKVAGKAVKGHEKRMHGMKSGGMAKKYAKGGSIDGCATKGKTKGRMV